MICHHFLSHFLLLLSYKSISFFFSPMFTSWTLIFLKCFKPLMYSRGSLHLTVSWMLLSSFCWVHLSLLLFDLAKWILKELFSFSFTLFSSFQSPDMSLKVMTLFLEVFIEHCQSILFFCLQCLCKLVFSLLSCFIFLSWPLLCFSFRDYIPTSPLYLVSALYIIQVRFFNFFFFSYAAGHRTFGFLVFSLKDISLLSFPFRKKNLFYHRPIMVWFQRWFAMWLKIWCSTLLCLLHTQSSLLF